MSGGRPQRLRLGRAAAEFFVVLFGVMAALAGENWRQAQGDMTAARAYVDRLTVEVEATMLDLEEQRSRTEETQAAMLGLLRHLEDGSTLTGDSIVSLVLTSARTGYNREQFGSDVTYRELIASGHLGLIGDPLLRERLVMYYSLIDMMTFEAADVVPLQDRVAQLTGYRPFQFLLGERQLTPEDRARLLGDLTNDDGLAERLRLAHSDLAQVLYLMSLVEDEASGLLEALKRFSRGAF